MKIEIKNYTYEQMPDFIERAEGSFELVMTGDEIQIEYLPNVVYDGDLRLQIIRPKQMNYPNKKYPCIVFIQGSAWMKQDIYRNVPNLGKLAALGYVCALVEYRHSGIAHFPSCIVDTKNAIRFLKKNADEYHVDVEKMVVMGDSSGGQVSCLTGMTCHTDLLDENHFDGFDCEVKGIINLYGAIEVTLPYGFPITENHQLPDSPEGMYLGFNIRENEEKAKVANALTYVDEVKIPMLILHGTKDRLVYCEQSQRLYEAMRKEGKDVTLYYIKGADHGGAPFWTKEVVDIYHNFIQRCIK